MAKRKKPTLSGMTILRLILGVPAALSLLGRIGTLMGAEARLAGRSLVGIIVLALLCALLLASSWFCVLALLFVYLSSLQWSIQVILLTLLAINLFMLLILFLIISRYKSKLLFPETRYLMQEVRDIYEEI